LKSKSKSDNRWQLPAFTLFTAAFLSILIISYPGQTTSGLATASKATMVAEPLLPTRTPMALDTVESSTVVPATATPASTKTVEPTPSPTPTVIATTSSLLPGDGFIPDIERFGMTGGIPEAMLAYDDGLQFSHLLNWHVMVDAPTRDIVFWQMVRLSEEGIRQTTWEMIEQAIEAYPGSNWLVGNEPDVKWQDNVTPERYAELYHDVYTFIKERDPDAKLVIGGVSQSTPLRRAYLDIVLDSYQAKYGEPMPVDIWNVHAFTLREEADSWGVDIPPGMDVQTGMLYEIEDHNDVTILRQNLIDFRAWMYERGFGDKPLVVSEYGILMPEDYGFDTAVIGKFMTESFDMFLSLANETGYAADGYRLVQWWFWYIVHEDDYYPTGILFDYPNHRMTPLGDIWIDYVNRLSADGG